jgi:lysophospholipase L1-like esterase
VRDDLDGRRPARMTARPLAALVAALGTCVLASAAPALAQGTAPTLQVTAASVRQAGPDLQFGLRFNRAVPVAELQAASGRIVCVVLSPLAPSRRRACVSRRDGRLTATLAHIEGGAATEPPRALRSARIVAHDDLVTLRVPAAALRVSLGRRLDWQAYVQWRDGSECTLLPDPASCIQVLPASGVLTFMTHPAGATGHPSTARRHGLRLLATGDSMIQIVDGYLARRLATRPATSVRSDAHIGSAISNPGLLDWPRRARAQAAGFKPDVTVMFLGANEGFALRSAGGARAPCCGAAWVAAYARRVEAMMRSYLRGGRSRVYWLTLPAPRPEPFARVFPRVNEAIRRAARRVGDGAHVVDLVPVFTPGGRFRQTITFRGRTIDARQPDGIHLSFAGASVAATLVIDRLRADGALR